MTIERTMEKWQRIIDVCDALDQEYDEFMSDWQARHNVIVSERSQLHGEIFRVYGVNPYEYQSPDALERDVLVQQVDSMAVQMETMRAEIERLSALVDAVPVTAVKPGAVAVVSGDVIPDVVLDAAGDDEVVIFEELFDAPLDDAKWTNGETAWGSDWIEGNAGTIQKFDASMVEFRDGIGVFKIEKLDTPVERKDGTMAKYLSYMLQTAGKFSYLYGRLKFRCKVPATVGAWSAVWTLGAKNIYAWLLEKDFEWFGALLKATAEWNKHRMRTTVHYRDPDDLDDNGNPRMLNHGTAVDDPKYDFGDWNDYEMDWSPEYIRFYINGELVFEVTDPKAIPREPAYLLISANVGGASGDPALGTFPAQAEFGYIQVVQHRMYAGEAVVSDSVQQQMSS